LHMTVSQKKRRTKFGRDDWHSLTPTLRRCDVFVSQIPRTTVDSDAAYDPAQSLFAQPMPEAIPPTPLDKRERIQCGVPLNTHGRWKRMLLRFHTDKRTSA
jgi:hypothetical protein